MAQDNFFFFAIFSAWVTCIYLKLSVLLGKKTTSGSIRSFLIKSLTFELPSALIIMILKDQKAKIYIAGIVQCKLRKERTEKLFIVFQRGWTVISLIVPILPCCLEKHFCANLLTLNIPLFVLTTEWVYKTRDTIYSFLGRDRGTL